MSDIKVDDQGYTIITMLHDAGMFIFPVKVIQINEHTLTVEMLNNSTTFVDKDDPAKITEISKLDFYPTYLTAMGMIYQKINSTLLMIHEELNDIIDRGGTSTKLTAYSLARYNNQKIREQISTLGIIIL